jgi:molybdenum cofactor guanylyltransferase
VPLLGAIIAGGGARRFGGDKASAKLAGRAIIDHVIDAVLPQVNSLVIVGRDWPGYPTIHDHPSPGLGPLGGLCAALKFAQSSGYTSVLTAGCDVLPIPNDLATRLHGAGAAIVAGQYLLGLWPADFADPLERHIAAQADHSMRLWIRETRARVVDGGAVFHNLNTPDDLARYAVQFTN